MGPSRWNYCTKIRLVVRLGILAAVSATAQDIKLSVTYVCNGERLYVENCNIRDLSDTSTCMVGHPDRPTRNGIMAYTTETRGALKKLLPTCTQPSAKEVAAAQAFQKKQQDLYNANVQKANDQLEATVKSVASGPQQKPKTPEQRAISRCITAGRLPASCMGNALLGAFGQMISQVLPSAAKEYAAGPAFAGVFQGAGNWRLDFQDPGVLVNCAFLSPDEHSYSVQFRNNLGVITIDTKPQPLVLTLKADGTMVAQGPFTLDGVVATGTTSGGPFKDQNGVPLTDSQAAASHGPVYDAAGNRVYGTPMSHATFASRRVTCPALNLSSKGAGVGVQTMETDLLKTMVGGEKGPPTPPGIRMRGIFAASTGFSTQFYPESVVLGCGPDAARAYPYRVTADGTRSFIRVEAPDHPLTLTFRPDGSLDAGDGPYQVHGRVVTGQNNDDDFTFAPLEQTCNLGILSPSAQIPAEGGNNSAVVSSAGTPAPASTNGAGGLSTPAAPLGNATLSIVSGFPAQPGAPNPLAGHPYVLLRDSYADALAKGGVRVPPGMSPYKYVGTSCASRTPECEKILNAIKTASASAVRASANGSGVLSGVPPGTYYLMISTRFNNQVLVWDQPVQLKPGSNSLTLDRSNASPVN